MKAISLHQPWASLIAVGAKHIETRSWSTSYRGPLAIHAAKRMPEQAYSLGSFTVGWRDGRPVLWHWDGVPSWQPDTYEFDELPLGAVVATCRLVDVVPTDHSGELPGWLDEESCRDFSSVWVGREELPYGDFRSGRYAWLLADVKALPEPLPAKGRQGLWEWSGGGESD